MKPRTAVIVLIILSLILFAGCQKPTPGPVLDIECTTDSDCIPAQCCHPTSCKPGKEQPECAAVLCSMECRPGTMDCGGKCLCQEGKCVAQLNDL